MGMDSNPFALTGPIDQFIWKKWIQIISKQILIYLTFVLVTTHPKTYLKVRYIRVQIDQAGPIDRPKWEWIQIHSR